MTLPTVTYDAETEEISVDTSVRTKLKVHGLPVASSFALYKHLQRYCWILMLKYIKINNNSTAESKLMYLFAVLLFWLIHHLMKKRCVGALELT